MIEKIKPLTIDEASDVLHCSKNYTYRLIREGKLRANRIGQNYLISPSAIDDLVNAGGR